MRIALLGTVAAAFVLTSCSGGGVYNRNRPDELAVSRQAPLVVPPEFNLTPPRPGAPRPVVPDSETQALKALFGADAVLPARSKIEDKVIEESGAGQASSSIRNTSGNMPGDKAVETVSKGGFLKQLLDAPAGDRDAAVATLTAG